jgi:hypothetical protein
MEAISIDARSENIAKAVRKRGHHSRDGAQLYYTVDSVAAAVKQGYEEGRAEGVKEGLRYSRDSTRHRLETILREHHDERVRRFFFGIATGFVGALIIAAIIYTR